MTLNAVYSICNQGSLKSFQRIFISRRVFHFHFYHWGSIIFNRISCTRSWKINGKHSFISVTAGECFCTGFDDWFTQMRFQLSACKIKIHNVWRRLQTEKWMHLLPTTNGSNIFIPRWWTFPNLWWSILKIAFERWEIRKFDDSVSIH